MLVNIEKKRGFNSNTLLTSTREGGKYRGGSGGGASHPPGEGGAHSRPQGRGRQAGPEGRARVLGAKAHLGRS